MPTVVAASDGQISVGAAGEGGRKSLFSFSQCFYVQAASKCNCTRKCLSLFILEISIPPSVRQAPDSDTHTRKWNFQFTSSKQTSIAPILCLLCKCDFRMWGPRSTEIKKAINCLEPNPAIILTFSRFYRTRNLKKQIYSESTSWWYFNQETAAFYASKVRRAVLWGACTYCWLCLQLEIARHAYPLCVLAASAAISECRLRI